MLVQVHRLTDSCFCEAQLFLFLLNKPPIQAPTTDVALLTVSTVLLIPARANTAHASWFAKFSRSCGILTLARTFRNQSSLFPISLLTRTTRVTAFFSDSCRQEAPSPHCCIASLSRSTARKWSGVGKRPMLQVSPHSQIVKFSDPSYAYVSVPKPNDSTHTRCHTILLSSGLLRVTAVHSPRNESCRKCGRDAVPCVKTSSRSTLSYCHTVAGLLAAEAHACAITSRALGSSISAFCQNGPPPLVTSFSSLSITHHV